MKTLKNGLNYVFVLGLMKNEKLEIYNRGKYELSIVN